MTAAKSHNLFMLSILGIFVMCQLVIAQQPPPEHQWKQIGADQNKLGQQAPPNWPYHTTWPYYPTPPDPLIGNCRAIDECSCESPYGIILQLRHLSEYIEKQTKYLTATDNQGIQYHFNPCKSFTAYRFCGSCQNVTACKIDPGHTCYPYGLDIGDVKYVRPSFSWITSRYLPEGIFQIYYNPYYDYGSLVTCKCDKNYLSQPKFVALGQPVGVSDNYYEFELHHACCCPGECQYGMPTATSGMQMKDLTITAMVTLVVVIIIVIGGTILYHRVTRLHPYSISA